MRTILAAVDFSEGSRAALGFAARLARQCHGALHVLHAQDPTVDAALRHEGRNLIAETGDELRRFLAATWPAPTCHPRLDIVAGDSAADVIRHIASREGADLIVIGSRGLSTGTPLPFGSTAEYVLRRADTSVLVVPPDWTPPNPGAPDLAGVGPVIAGIDFSEPAALAAAAAGRLAAALQTSVDIVHVVHQPRLLARWQRPADDVVRERMLKARCDLEPIVRCVSAVHGLPARVKVELRVEAGDVSQQLVGVARSYADRSPIIVLGRRTERDRGAPPGAVAYRTLAQATVPVLMHVPPA